MLQASWGRSGHASSNYLQALLSGPVGADGNSRISLGLDQICGAVQWHILLSVWRAKSIPRIAAAIAGASCPNFVARSRTRCSDRSEPFGGGRSQFGSGTNADFGKAADVDLDWPLSLLEFFSVFNLCVQNIPKAKSCRVFNTPIGAFFHEHGKLVLVFSAFM